MAGKDELANAVLGGSSDYIADITTHMRKAFSATDDEKVIIRRLQCYLCMLNF